MKRIELLSLNSMIVELSKSSLLFFSPLLLIISNSHSIFLLINPVATIPIHKICILFVCVIKYILFRVPTCLIYREDVLLSFISQNIFLSLQYFQVLFVLVSVASNQCTVFPNVHLMHFTCILCVDTHVIFIFLSLETML